MPLTSCAFATIRQPHVGKQMSVGVIEHKFSGRQYLVVL